MFDWYGFVLLSVMLRLVSRPRLGSSSVPLCVGVDGHTAMIHSMRECAMQPLYNSYSLLIRLLSSSTVLVL